GPDLNLLARIGPAILWIGALLATLLTLDRLFQGDRDDGVLDLLLMGDTAIELVVFVKCLAHWSATGLPLVIVSPCLAVFMNMDPDAIL
ncbi:heme exporter protein CcmB, partial [Acinetobacter baumannii]